MEPAILTVGDYYAEMLEHDPETDFLVMEKRYNDLIKAALLILEEA